MGSSHEIHEGIEIHEVTSKGFVYFVGFVIFVVNVGCGSPGSQAVRAVMRSPIAPASDALFNAVVYTNGQLASAPQTDEQWGRLRAHAESLQAAGATLMRLAPPERQDEWQRQSVALIQASAEAVKATDARSLDAVLEAGGRLYSTCTGCHTPYMEKGEP